MRIVINRTATGALRLFMLVGAGAAAVGLMFGDRSSGDIVVIGLLAALAAGSVAILGSVAASLRASDISREELEMRLAQQQAVARLGQLALTDAPAQELFEEACRIVGAELRTDLAGVLQIVPGEEALVMRAGVGWSTEQRGARLPAGPRSHGGYTLAAGRPVIIRDARRETRFDLSAPMVEQGITSGLSVTIGSNGGAFGVLGAHTYERREFSDDDVAFLSAVANVLASALRRSKAEEDAEKAHRVLEAVIEGTTDDIFVKDLEGRFVALNARAAETLGRPKEQLLGRTLDEVLPQPVARRMAETDRLTLARGTVETFEEALHLHGGPRVLLTTKGPYRARDGTLQGTFGIAHDITERKAQELALARSEERFRLAQEGARMGTWDIDLVSGAATWSAGLRAIYGVGSDAPTSFEHFARLLHPDDRERVTQIVEESYASGADFDLECRIHRPDGQLRWVLARSSAIRTDDGKAVRVLGVAVDITERKLAEEELVRSEETLRLAQAAAQIGAWDWDLATDELRWTPGVYEIFGLDPATYEPSYASMFTHIHDEDRSVLEATVRRALASADSHYECPCRVVHSSGEIRWVITRGTIIRSDDGTPKRLIGITLDNTERRRVEARLRQAEKLEAIGQLAGGVAHDFNNLLVAIRGYGELALGRYARGEDGAPQIEEVLATADRAAGLTKQLLAFGRRQMLNPTVLDLNEVVRETAGLLQRVIGGNVELVLRLSPRPVTVKADRGQLEQVITNLAVNGRDAMNGGGVLTIRVTSTGRGTGEEFGFLTVTDEGSGIDAATAARIFEPFFTTKGERGTGLGLATVHGIVAQSGGHISVDSEPGLGASFNVCLPLIRDRAALLAEPAVRADSRGSESILVVEDDAAVRSIVSTMLEGRGYEILDAAGGEEAIARFRECDSAIPLVISDVMMRGLNGRQTIDRIRDLEPATKVLFMSGYTDDAALRNGELTSRTGFIQKPFSGDELATRVRELLDQAA